MMSKVAAGVLAVVAASFTAGCEEDGPRNGSMPPVIRFMTSDLSTGVSVATIWIARFGAEVPLDLANALAAQLRISTWPGDVPVSASRTASTFPTYVRIDLTLVATLDKNGWYRVSMPQRQTDDYQVSDDLVLAHFDGGALGIRISPAHPPVVSSVMSCGFPSGMVEVSAGFSEPVTKPVGALALDYGAPAAPCMVLTDDRSVTDFLCYNASGAAPFALQIGDTVTAEASGAAVAAGTLSSADMQSAILGNGCVYYSPTTVD